MSRRGAQLTPSSKGGRTRGGTHVGTRGDLMLPHVPRTARNHQPQNPARPGGWTFLLTSRKPEKKDEEDRHFFSPVMKKNDTQTASCIFFQYCLCFKSGEREMNAENSGCATKKMCIPKQNPKLKRHSKMNFICTKLIKCSICLQSSEITGQPFQNDY